MAISSTSFKKGHSKLGGIGKGQRMSMESRARMRLARVGMKLSLEHRRHISEALRGPKNHFWRGGQVSENMKVRLSFEYKEWRKAVFERDDYTCVSCGRRGGTLHADHIRSFADYPELRLLLENGRTLCKPCHIKTDTYLNHGHKNKKAI